MHVPKPMTVQVSRWEMYFIREGIAHGRDVPWDVTTVRETMQGLFELPVCTDETVGVGQLRDQSKTIVYITEL
jgi:hypothetical protein